MQSPRPLFSCPKVYPPGSTLYFLVSQADFGALLFFLSTTGCNQFTLFLNLPGEHIDQNAGKVQENNSLTTSSSTLQTEDYYFNEKLCLKTLNPKKTQWGHFICQIFFLLMNICEVPAVCEYTCLLFSGVVGLGAMFT